MKNILKLHLGLHLKERDLYSETPAPYQLNLVIKIILIYIYQYKNYAAG